MLGMRQPSLIPNPDDWMTTAAAAALIGVHRTNFHALVKEGRIHAFRPAHLQHEVNPSPIYWRAEIESYANAYRLIKG